MSLSDVELNGDHVAAHNNERHALNALTADTGWRDITKLYLPNRVSLLFVRRIGNAVHCTMDPDYLMQPSDSDILNGNGLPPGFAPAPGVIADMHVYTDDRTPSGVWCFGTDAMVSWTGQMNVPQRGYTTWLTEDAVPNPLPGIAVTFSA